LAEDALARLARILLHLTAEIATLCSTAAKEKDRLQEDLEPLEEVEY